MMSIQIILNKITSNIQDRWHLFISQKKLFHPLVAYLGLALIVFIFYYNALFHIPRADILSFILCYKILHIQKLWQVIQYGFVVTKFKGHIDSLETLIFRPLYFIIVDLRIYLFGYNFVLWNLLDIILHIFVVLLLYYYLSLLNNKTRFFNFLISLLFGVLYSSTEMVLWSAVTGNILFCLFFLFSLIFIEKFFLTKKIKYTLIAPVFALFASLSYDSGAVFSVILALFVLSRLVFTKNNKHTNDNKKIHLCSILFLLVPIIYFMLGFMPYIHQLLLFLKHYPKSRLYSYEKFFPFLFKTIGFWFISSMLPMLHQLLPGSRITSTPIPFFLHHHRKGLFSFPLHYLSWLNISSALFFLIASLWLSIINRFKSINWRLCFVASILIIFYASIITWGRSLSFGLEYTIYSCTYLVYTFFLFFSILLFSLFNPIFELKSPLSKKIRRYIYLSLFIIIIMNACKLWNIIYTQRYVYSEKSLQLINSITALKKKKFSDKHFSFNVEKPCIYDLNIKILDGRYPIIAKLHKNYTLTKIFFPFSYKENKAKYTIPCPKQ